MITLLEESLSTPIALAEIITLACLTASFFLFMFLAIRFRHAEGGILRSFKLQLSLAILFWIIGEAFGLMGKLEMTMYFHTFSMALLTLFLLYRIRSLTRR